MVHWSLRERRPCAGRTPPGVNTAGSERGRQPLESLVGELFPALPARLVWAPERTVSVEFSNSTPVAPSTPGILSVCGGTAQIGLELLKDVDQRRRLGRYRG